MATILFYAKEETSASLSIMCRISDKGKTKQKSIGYALPAEKIKGDWRYWDKKNKRAKAHDLATDINAKLSAWSSKFNEYKGKVKRGEIEFDFNEAFQFTSEGKVGIIKTPTLQSVARDFIDAHKKDLKGSTVTNYETMLLDITAYEKHITHEHKLLEVNKEFYRKYGLFLIEELDNVNSTVNRKIGRIITLMGWAFEKGYIDTQRYKIRYTFKGHESSRFPLTQAEIDALYKFETTEPFERVVVDAFLFACESGLRVSDIWQLRPQHIKSYKDKDGVIKYIDFTQIKNTDHNLIPLSTNALLLLHRQEASSVFFSFKYSQSANKTLKRAAKEQKLNRLIEIVQTKGNETTREMRPLHEIISFHFARNTYISLLLANGVNPIFVQGNVGHSDLKTTMGYSKQADITRWKETLKIQNKGTKEL